MPPTNKREPSDASFVAPQDEQVVQEFTERRVADLSEPVNQLRVSIKEHGHEQTLIIPDVEEPFQVISMGTNFVPRVNLVVPRSEDYGEGGWLMVYVDPKKTLLVPSLSKTERKRINPNNESILYGFIIGDGKEIIPVLLTKDDKHTYTPERITLLENQQTEIRQIEETMKLVESYLNDGEPHVQSSTYRGKLEREIPEDPRPVKFVGL